MTNEPLVRAILGALLLASSACVTFTTAPIRQAGYDAAAEKAIKRVNLMSWAEDETLAKVLTAVAADRINLTLDYLVYDKGVLKRGWSDHCNERDGVLTIRPLWVGETDDQVSMAVEVTLFDCRTGAIVWREAGADKADALDDDLAKMAESYEQEIGPGAGKYTAAAFLVLRDLLEKLPNPTLNDDDIMEKIELSIVASPHTDDPA